MQQFCVMRSILRGSLCEPGLVVITPAAGFVTPGWSIAIGALGAPWCYLTVEAVNRINLVDDTLDAFGLHGSGGFAGAILTGIFAVDEGLIYSGSFVLLGSRLPVHWLVWLSLLWALPSSWES